MGKVVVKSPSSSWSAKPKRVNCTTRDANMTVASRGVARIFGMGQTVPCQAEPDPASTEVVKSMRGVWVLPQKKFPDSALTQ